MTVIISKQATKKDEVIYFGPDEYLGWRITVDRPILLTYLTADVLWGELRKFVWTIWTEKDGLPGEKIKEVESGGGRSITVIFNQILKPGNYWITCYSPTPLYAYGMNATVEECDLVKGKPPNWVRFRGGVYGIVYGEEIGTGTLDCHAYADATEVSANVLVTGVGSYKTPFKIELQSGSYHLIAEYADQKLEKDVTITTGLTTRVDFLFTKPTKPVEMKVPWWLLAIPFVGIAAYLYKKYRKA